LNGRLGDAGGLPWLTSDTLNFEPAKYPKPR
jgi:hypothetical protein